MDNIQASDLWRRYELEIATKLKSFTLLDFNNPAKVAEYVEVFDIRGLCTTLEADRIASRASGMLGSVTAFEEKPMEPQYDDLARLHWIALSRKTINVLEFGSGFSTAILADAMRRLHRYFADWVKENIRVENPFHVYTVEEDQRFLEISRSRLGCRLSPFASITRSSVELTTHDSRIATVFTKVPNVSPDLIYLDGPSQYATTEELNGFSIASRVRMPMSADILRFEFFLEPGTLVITDGRTQNARFLKSYLRRSWAYEHDPVGDIHYFELQEEPLGRFNRRKMEFSLNGQWLLGV